MLRVKNGSILWKMVCGLIITVFAITILCSDVLRVKNSAFAAVKDLPSPVKLLKASNDFQPPMLKGIYFDSQNPFDIQFLLDPGDSRLSKRKRQEQAAVQVRYFLAGLVTPAERLWVNLSPHEKDKVIAQEHETTELGRDMLKDDYLLKQFTSSLTHPDTDIGKQYWNNIDLPKQQQDNKIWIKPGKIDLYSKEGFAVIDSANLKVESQFKGTNCNAMITAVSKEVNNGKNFTRVRQLYHSLILSSWFKNQVKEGLYKKYTNSSKVKGINITDTRIKDQVYSLYKKSFEKGVYNITKKSPISNFESRISKNRQRRFFSGGMQWTGLKKITSSSLTKNKLNSMRPQLANTWHVSVKCASSRVEDVEQAKPMVVKSQRVVTENFKKSESSSALHRQIEEDKNLDAAEQRALIQSVINVGRKDRLTYEGLGDILRVLLLPECEGSIKIGLIKLVHTLVSSEKYDFMHLSAVEVMLDVIEQNLELDVISDLVAAISEFYVLGRESGPGRSDISKASQLNEQTVRRILSVADIVGGTDVFRYLMDVLHAAYFGKNMDQIKMALFEEMLSFVRRHSEDNRIDQLSALIVMAIRKNKTLVVGKGLLSEILEIIAETPHFEVKQGLSSVLAWLSGVNRLVHLDKDLQIKIIDLSAVNAGIFAGQNLANVIMEASLKSKVDKISKEVFIKTQKILESMRGLSYANRDLARFLVFSFLEANIDERKELFDSDNAKAWHAVFNDVPSEVSLGLKSMNSNENLMALAVDIDSFEAAAELKRFLCNYYQRTQKKMSLSDSQLEATIPEQAIGIYKLQWDMFTWIMANRFDEVHNENTSPERLEEIIGEYYKKNEASSALRDQIEQDKKLDATEQRTFIQSVINVGSRNHLSYEGLCDILRVLLLPECEGSIKIGLIKLVYLLVNSVKYDFMHLSAVEVMLDVIEQNLELDVISDLAAVISEFYTLGKTSGRGGIVISKASQLNEQTVKRILSVADLAVGGAVFEYLMKTVRSAHSVSNIDKVSKDLFKELLGFVKKHRDEKVITYLTGLLVNDVRNNKSLVIDKDLLNEILQIIAETSNDAAAADLSRLVALLADTKRLVNLDNDLLIKIIDFIAVNVESFAGMDLARTIMKATKDSKLDKINKEIFLKAQNIIESTQVRYETKIDLMWFLVFNFVATKIDERKELYDSDNAKVWHAVFSDVPQDINIASQDFELSEGLLNLANDMKSFVRAAELKRFLYNEYQQKKEKKSLGYSQLKKSIPEQALGIYKLQWDMFTWIMANRFDEVHNENVTEVDLENIIKEYHATKDQNLSIGEQKEIMDNALMVVHGDYISGEGIALVFRAISLPEYGSTYKHTMLDKVKNAFIQRRVKVWPNSVMHTMFDYLLKYQDDNVGIIIMHAFVNSKVENVNEDMIRRLIDSAEALDNVNLVESLIVTLSEVHNSTFSADLDLSMVKKIIICLNRAQDVVYQRYLSRILRAESLKETSVVYDAQVFAELQKIIAEGKVPAEDKAELIEALIINWIRQSKSADIKNLSDITAQYEWQSVLSGVPNDLYNVFMSTISYDSFNGSLNRFLNKLLEDQNDIQAAAKLKRILYVAWSTKQKDSSTFFSFSREADISENAIGIYKLPWDEFTWIMENYFDVVNNPECTQQEIEAIINEYHTTTDQRLSEDQQMEILKKAYSRAMEAPLTNDNVNFILRAMKLPVATSERKRELSQMIQQAYFLQDAEVMQKQTLLNIISEVTSALESGSQEHSLVLAISASEAFFGKESEPIDDETMEIIFNFIKNYADSKEADAVLEMLAPLSAKGKIGNLTKSMIDQLIGLLENSTSDRFQGAVADVLYFGSVFNKSPGFTMENFRNSRNL